MTERKINSAMGRIDACKKSGFGLEALIRTYLLNVDLLRFILSVTAPEQKMAGKKIKVLLKVFIKESALHPELKSVIQKSSLKAFNLWHEKMEAFFKALKSGQHVNPKALLNESEKIFALLKISAVKMLANSN